MSFSQPHPPGTLTRINTLAYLDDAPFDHIALRRAVKRSQAVNKTFSFYDAYDALDFLKTSDRAGIDAFMVDLHMPRMGGLEFIRTALADIGPGFATRVYLALTLEPDEELQAEMDALGCISGWIEKPITTAVLGQLATEFQIKLTEYGG